MTPGWAAPLLTILRLPTRPKLPDGATEVHVFRASRNDFRYRVVLWALAQVGGLIALLAGFYLSTRATGGVSGSSGWFIRAAEVSALLVYLLQIPLTLAALQLDFDLRWYILTDRALRIREGVLSVREKTMTFANIQHIDVHENPIQRFLGIADVKVRTAGGGGQQSGRRAKLVEPMHEATFRGVDRPHEIVARIREGVDRHRDAGLGDPDDPTGLGESGGASDLLGAAGTLSLEMRQLRSELEPRLHRLV